MKKLMFAAVAALAMVGAANAAPSYGIEASCNVAPYELDTNPGYVHAGWYSSYVMKQEDAQAAMGLSGTAVDYNDVADWLGENFAANKASVIANAESMPSTEYLSVLSQYSSSLEGEFAEGEEDLTSAIGVYFYKDDDNNLAYNVMANGIGMSFDFDDKWYDASGWQAVAVPEPTSGLLMLLGVAGLALKRRRA